MLKRTNGKFGTAVAAVLVLIVSAMPGQVQALSDKNGKKKCTCTSSDEVLMPNSVYPNCLCCPRQHYNSQTKQCNVPSKSN